MISNICFQSFYYRLLPALERCANELIFMERTKAAVSVDFATNPANPWKLQQVIKGHTAIVPQNSQSDYANPQSVHKGEALSLIHLSICSIEETIPSWW